MKLLKDKLIHRILFDLSLLAFVVQEKLVPAFEFGNEGHKIAVIRKMGHQNFPSPACLGNGFNGNGLSD